MKVLVLPGRIEPSDLPELCRRLRSVAAATERSVVVCDASALQDPDAAAVDVLARLQLAARRRGFTIALTDTPVKLYDLLELAGLASVLPSRGPALESVRETEERKEPSGVEEETDATYRPI